MPEIPKNIKQDYIKKINGLAQDGKRFNQETLDRIDIFDDISIDSFVSLGLQILNCKSTTEAYDLLAQTPPESDSCFYDRLIAELQHVDAYRHLDLTLRQNEPVKVDRALDIATGSGMCGVLLTQYARNVVVTDLSLPLIKEAIRYNGEVGKTTSFMGVTMDANVPAFAPETFDIITSNALTHYLTTDQEAQFYMHVYEMLKPGGRYYEPQRERADSDQYYRASPRGELANFIVRAVLALRDDTIILGKKQPFIDYEKLGFGVSTFIFQQTPYIKQVLKLVKNN